MRRTYHHLIQFPSRYRIIAIGVLFAFWCPLLFADTTWVAGNVSGVWSRRGNPYLVTETLTIPHDSTLQILPGVQIYFQNQHHQTIPINVLGHLRAIGEEGDSIYFYSPDSVFSGFYNYFTHNSEIRLEYCSIGIFSNSGIVSRDGNLVIKHSRISGHHIIIECVYQENDTLLYNVFQEDWYHGGSIELSSGSAVFQYNQGSNVVLGIHWQNMISIHDNIISAFSISSCNPIEFYNNQTEENAHIIGTSTHCYNNIIRTLLSFDFSTSLIENNEVGNISLWDSNVIIRENIINGQVEVNSAQTTIENNLIVSDAPYTFTTGIEIWEASASIIIRNNTIYAGGYGIYIFSLMPQQIINNIIVGDDVNCTGIYNSVENSSVIRYNNVYNFTTPTYQCQLDSGNIFFDPFFRAGNPYDYHLQANSPCIDTGDPTSPLDPDGTRADMGCYFFDHRIDNPPAIISPVVVNVQRGTTLRYIAKATDDFGLLNFGFWNLPPWLYRVPELMDFMQKYAVVQGRVPQGQGNFTFGIWVEDGSAQRDSQIVSVLISPYTILEGNVTGVLTLENSPYLVTQNVVIPGRDSLTIDPGVELLFQWDNNPDFRHRIIVRGKLSAVGTPADTIRFSPEFGDSLLNGWRGIWCVGSPFDTSIIEYVKILNGNYGIASDSQAVVTVSHVKIVDTRHGVSIRNHAWASVDSCQFLVYNPFYNQFVDNYTGTAVVTNSHSEFFVNYQYGMHFEFEDTARGSIHGCTFIGTWGGRAEYGSWLELIGNTMMNYSSGINYANSASGIVANNIIIGGNGLYCTGGDSILFSNNLLYHTDVGFRSTGLPEASSIRNNIFLNNHTGVQVLNTPPTQLNLGYNDFYGNDNNLVNCHGDTTNIFLDPIVQDTINFRLSAGSPCIDAGDPDPFFNDVDSTRNDIGCWGGPWGESYSYTPVLSQQTKPFPTEFALLPPYPNPFNSVLVIPFTIPIQKEVNINIYNILGQKVQGFTFPHLSPGVHRVVWNSGSCASGLYLIQLTSDNKEFNQKVLLLK